MIDQKYAVYLHVLDPGRFPECIAGPFDSRAEAEDWLLSHHPYDDVMQGECGAVTVETFPVI